MPDINHNKIISLLLFSWLASLFAYAGATRAADERQVAGQVVLFKGGAFATNQGASRNLTQGAAIYIGDKILTGGKTRVKLRMIDDAQIMLGDDTAFSVTEYRFDRANSKGQGTLGVLKEFFVR